MTYLVSLIYTALCHKHKNKKSQSNLGRAASPPVTAENNYATKSPLVTMGCPIYPKTALPFDDLHSNLIHPSLDRPHSNGILIHSAILSQYTFRSHRQNNAWYAERRLRLIVSDAANNGKKLKKQKSRKSQK